MIAPILNFNSRSEMYQNQTTYYYAMKDFNTLKKIRNIQRFINKLFKLK